MFIEVEPYLLLNDAHVLYVRRHPDFLEIGLSNNNTIQVTDPKKIIDLLQAFDNILNVEIDRPDTPSDAPTEIWTELRSAFLKL